MISLWMSKYKLPLVGGQTLQLTPPQHRMHPGPLHLNEMHLPHKVSREDVRSWSGYISHNGAPSTKKTQEMCIYRAHKVS